MLERVASDLRAAHELHQLVVVHGAGSFGHHEAAAHGIAHGGLPGASRTDVARGIALTRSSVMRLNQLVVTALLEAGLPACGLSPCGVWETAGGRVAGHAAAGVAAVQALLDAGLVPVLHGDAVLDTEQGCAILSGDTIVRCLAEALQPAWVVFLTDVAGIFDRPPQEPGARLMREVVVSATEQGPTMSFSEAGAAQGGGGGAAPSAAHAAAATSADGDVLASVRMAAEAHDTTGGMATKVAEAAAVARLGIPVIIAAAGSAAAEAACLVGPEVRRAGTAALTECTVVRC